MTQETRTPPRGGSGTAPPRSAAADDLKGLPPGSRVLLVARDYVDCSGEDIERIKATFLRQWQEGQRVLCFSGMDVFVMTPDGKITGTAAQAPTEELQ